MNRPNILIFVPVALAWPLLLGSWRWKRALLFVAAVVVPIVPVTLRNGIVARDWMLISSQGGPQLDATFQLPALLRQYPQQFFYF